MKRLFSLVFLAVTLVGCSEDDQKKYQKKREFVGKPAELSSKELTDLAFIGDEDGPPFKVPCPCTFKELGSVRVSKNRFELLVSGKGWNPVLKACDWEWGELIYNEMPPDTLISEIRIHLLDLENAGQTPDKDFLRSKAFQNNLIATFINKWQKDSTLLDTVLYDPNNLGKYERPRVSN